MQELKVALVGNPNCGKTSLFNALTGLNQKVSNFPGTTVDRKSGSFKATENCRIKLVDLPGTYSLYPKSEDEAVTFRALCDPQNTELPDVVLFVADASKLKRSLMLFTQVADLGLPVVIGLNMIDVAERKGISFNYELLESRLGVKLIPLNARKKTGIDALKVALTQAKRSLTAPFFEHSAVNKDMLEEIKSFLGVKNAYTAVLWAHNHLMMFSQEQELMRFRQILQKHVFCEKKEQADEIVTRFRTIDSILHEGTASSSPAMKASLSNKIDRVITHKYLGLLFFLLILFIIFQSIFSLASYPMDWMEYMMGAFSGWMADLLPDNMLSRLLVHGILPGLSGVLVFIPQIAILFLFIAILEDLGYMARVSFIMDRLMRQFGLNGKSIVPLISGMACAVPAIMSTRNIENKREKLITLMVIPLMSCSARLPVYTLLISLLTPAVYIGGVINLQGLILMALYLLGFLASICAAWVFSKILENKERNFFIMELPTYKMPLLNNVFLSIYEKSKSFVLGAGKIIIAVSIILWFMASYGPGKSMENLIQKQQEISLHLSAQQRDSVELQFQAERLATSYAGQFGKFIEPAIRPLGFDWKIGISLITSLAAREVFVGTMTTIYSVDAEAADFSEIRAKMQAELKPGTSEPLYSSAVVISLLVFYAFAMQCMSTLAITYRETHSLGWTFLQFFYLTVMAYSASFCLYQILS